MVSSQWSVFFDEVDILIRGVHKIMFARIALETVGMVERLDLALRFLRRRAVHVALLLHASYFSAPTDELHHTLVADEQKNDGKDDQREGVLAPFLYLNGCPKLRKSHNNYQKPPQSYEKICIYASFSGIFN